ncbi:carboxymuconolactone decarboxylase family protein [Afipia sp. GAS231]|uniref:carboxymuconolactone decarboxylase family protein n=1 Tax=Afipia sp. GAS231 TaxID=1882747 RepID=UPI00352A064E
MSGVQPCRRTRGRRHSPQIPRAALGVAFTTQCAYCIDTHTRHAVAYGASKQEIAEAAFVAAAVKAGGALAHSLLALRIFDQEKGGSVSVSARR